MGSASARREVGMTASLEFETTEKIRILPLRWLAATVSTVLWNPKGQSDVHLELERLPHQFPILSIRGWKDPLMSPSNIDKIFEPHLNLDWRKLSLPEAVHLNGLKDFPEEYSPGVLKFLKQFSTEI